MDPVILDCESERENRETGKNKNVGRIPIYWIKVLTAIPPVNRSAEAVFEEELNQKLPEDFPCLRSTQLPTSSA